MAPVKPPTRKPDKNDPKLSLSDILFSPFRSLFLYYSQHLEYFSCASHVAVGFDHRLDSSLTEKVSRPFYCPDRLFSIQNNRFDLVLKHVCQEGELDDQDDQRCPDHQGLESEDNDENISNLAGCIWPCFNESKDPIDRPSKDNNQGE